MPSDHEYAVIGTIGTINLGILALINVWRTTRFLTKEDYRNGGSFYKKLAFHVCLFFAAAVDIPLYVEFILEHKYTLTSYSFHKFSSAFLFAAFSITISDWAGVLYDINEYELQPFLLRKATLVGINGLYALVSMINFVFCYTLSDFDSYTNSSLYILGIFFQITVSLLLTLFMLSAGLKLAWRIHGVSGAQYDLGSHGSGSYGHAMRATNDKQFQQFSSALWNLNMVMGTCAVCIILQTILLVLDYALGYANSTSKTVGPTLFYWAGYFWLPLWGVTCSLLYLSRTHSKRQDLKHHDISAISSSETGYCNPLINSTDHPNNYFFDTTDYSVSGTGNNTATNSTDHRSNNPSNRPGGRRVDHSFDSNDDAGMLRLDSSNIYGDSDAGISGHTDQIFGATDTETEQMFGAVYSPDNSIGNNYRDSSLFSPAINSIVSPKDYRFSHT